VVGWAVDVNLASQLSMECITITEIPQIFPSTVDGGKNPIQMQNFPARSHKYLKLHMNRAQSHPHGRPLKIAQNYRIAVVCAMKIDLSRTQHLRSRIQHKFSFTAFSEATAAALFFLLYI